jgi:hypothetical protein
VFRALGRGLHFLFGGFVSWISHHLLTPLGGALAGDDGPVVTVVTVVGLVVLGSAAAWLLVRRRARHLARSLDHDSVTTDRWSADELDACAAAAAARGDFTRAVRWSFQAGVERLTDLGLIANGRARTPRQLRTDLDFAVFASLADTHERIVYGEQIATVEDATQAQWGWPEVVRHARERARVRSTS